MIDGFLVLVGAIVACLCAYSSTAVFYTGVGFVLLVVREVALRSSERDLKGECVVITGAG